MNKIIIPKNATIAIMTTIALSLGGLAGVNIIQQSTLALQSFDSHGGGADDGFIDDSDNDGSMTVDSFKVIKNGDSTSYAKPCFLKNSATGEKTDPYEHGTIVATPYANYQCNDGTWIKLLMPESGKPDPAKN